jgi:hypothetical protein
MVCLQKLEIFSQFLCDFMIPKLSRRETALFWVFTRRRVVISYRRFSTTNFFPESAVHNVFGAPQYLLSLKSLYFFPE